LLFLFVFTLYISSKSLKTASLANSSGIVIVVVSPSFARGIEQLSAEMTEPFFVSAAKVKP
jgi:hypothetical protein